MFSNSAFRAKSKSGASGELSNAEIKIAFGSTSGFGTIPYGLCLIVAHRPLSISDLIISSLLAVLMFGTSNARKSFVLSVLILTSRSFLFSPLIISETTPLAGEQKTISGRFLSASTGVPALTVSPSLTSNLIFTSLKSVGFTAIISEETVFVIWFLALPFKGMFKPLLNRIWFDIILKNFGAKIHIFCNFVLDEHRNLHNN